METIALDQVVPCRTEPAPSSRSRSGAGAASTSDPLGFPFAFAGALCRKFRLSVR